MDQLAALRLFIHVGRYKSISSAGRALGLSTTAASERLQDLETMLGMRSFDRTAITKNGRRAPNQFAEFGHRAEASPDSQPVASRFKLATGTAAP